MLLQLCNGAASLLRSPQPLSCLLSVHAARLGWFLTYCLVQELCRSVSPAMSNSRHGTNSVSLAMSNSHHRANSFQILELELSLPPLSLGEGNSCFLKTIKCSPAKCCIFTGERTKTESKLEKELGFKPRSVKKECMPPPSSECLSKLFHRFMLPSRMTKSPELTDRWKDTQGRVWNTI